MHLLDRIPVYRSVPRATVRTLKTKKPKNLNLFFNLRFLSALKNTENRHRPKTDTPALVGYTLVHFNNNFTISFHGLCSRWFCGSRGVFKLSSMFCFKFHNLSFKNGGSY